MDFRSQYFESTDFHTAIEDLKNDSNCNISVFHTNIQSLNCNFHRLEYLMHDLDFPFKIIGLTET